VTSGPAGSLEVRQLIPHSVLLAEPGGTTHADSLFGDLCVDNTIANYPASGQLPARNASAKRPGVGSAARARKAGPADFRGEPCRP
jgi:hypothetical protein